MAVRYEPGCGHARGAVTGLVVGAGDGVAGALGVLLAWAVGAAETGWLAGVVPQPARTASPAAAAMVARRAKADMALISFLPNAMPTRSFSWTWAVSHVVRALGPGSAGVGHRRWDRGREDPARSPRAKPRVAYCTSSGVTLGTSVAGRQLDDPVFEPVSAELDQRGSVVFLHPVGQDDTAWLAGHNLAWLAGAPFEDTAAALRLILAGVTDRYPRIRFIVPHLGGTIPFLLARVTRKSTAEITGGLRSMYYDTVSGSPDALTSACRAFGTDRLLFGTDYP
jgi:hypothetical protein